MALAESEFTAAGFKSYLALYGEALAAGSYAAARAAVIRASAIRDYLAKSTGALGAETELTEFDLEKKLAIIDSEAEAAAASADVASRVIYARPSYGDGR